MKGARAAKAAAEAAAKAEAEGGELSPSPPKGPREGPPRPGPVGTSGGGYVQIGASEFQKICEELRTNTLLGPAAADALLAAAGIGPTPAEQGKAAKDLRTEVANGRENGEKPKKKMGGFSEPEVIPDEEPAPAKNRASFSGAVDLEDAGVHDAEEIENHVSKDAPEPPELNLSPKQNGLRTKIEMWIMDELPVVYGVDDSEELEESLQEDGQADKVTFLIAETDEAAQKKIAVEWLKGAPDAEALEAFMTELLSKVKAIQDLAPKKKKKKKKQEE